VLVKPPLDENISPAAAIAFAADGIRAWHVRTAVSKEQPIVSCSIARYQKEDHILVQ
jgi:hypothetical protein